MLKEKRKDNTFYLGICMAGAVSAGAYTAGVMDYLLEALEAYERHRGKPGYPSHRVEIPVMGGASAGGMTAIITAAALQQGITPVKVPLAKLSDECPKNLLYHSWVDLTNEDMFSVMLETNDITDGHVVSALNCKFIAEIAKRAMTPVNPQKIAWKKTLPSFFSKRLELFTTLSNLAGFTYDELFIANNSAKRRPYYMYIHNDFACFELTTETTPKMHPGWMPLNIQTGENSEIAIQAAMATGAFPVGLKARELKRPMEVVNKNPLFDKRTLSAIQVKEDPYKSLNVDGGMINNEPFDKVRARLIAISGQSSSEDYENFEKFNSTVLMVAPFPSTKPTAIGFSAKLLKVIGLTLSAMISQMRTKPSEISDARNPECAGQFLIDPSREFHDQKGIVEVDIEGDKAIACGALGGFSGFLNKEFRVHDYFLGRYNCKIFLRDYFTVPDKAKKNNDIFRNGYEGITDEKYRSTTTAKGWQIIPLVEETDFSFPEMVFSSGKKWPQQNWSAIERFRSGLKKRLEALILNTVKIKPFKRFLLWIGTRLLLRGMLTKAVLETIKEELKVWHLIKNE